MKSALLIHDDPAARAALAALLRRREWQVWETDAPDTALTLARQHRPAVVLQAVRAAAGGAFGLFITLRAELGLDHARLVALCDPDPSLNRAQALEAGADEFLSAPVAPEEIGRLLDNLVAVETHPGTSATGTTVRFWGVRGSIPAPGPKTLEFGGNTSCIELRADGEIIVLDSGSGIRALGHELAAEFKVRPLRLTLLISHTHWDHIQGFPFFLPAYNRKNHIRILGYEGAREGLTRVFSLQMEGPYFPIDFKELSGNIVIEELKELQFQLGEVKVQAMFANHPGICMGYRLNTRHGAVVYLPDNEPCYLVHPHPRQQLGKLPTGATPSKAQEQRTLDFVRDADLLIMDAQYDARQYKSHMGWGHGCVDDVVQLAVHGEVKRLFLFHHDPDHDDAKVAQMVDDARQLARSLGSPIIIEGAREGECLKLFAG